jgi:hypothetical protein
MNNYLATDIRVKQLTMPADGESRGNGGDVIEAIFV